MTEKWFSLGNLKKEEGKVTRERGITYYKKESCPFCLEEHKIESKHYIESRKYKNIEISYPVIYKYCRNTNEYFETEELFLENLKSMEKAYNHKIEEMNRPKFDFCVSGTFDINDPDSGFSFKIPLEAIMTKEEIKETIERLKKEKEEKNKEMTEG